MSLRSGQWTTPAAPKAPPPLVSFYGQRTAPARGKESREQRGGGWTGGRTRRGEKRREGGAPVPDEWAAQRDRDEPLARVSVQRAQVGEVGERAPLLPKGPETATVRVMLRIGRAAHARPTPRRQRGRAAISLHLAPPRYISLHLATSRCISLHLAASRCISLHLAASRSSAARCPRSSSGAPFCKWRTKKSARVRLAESTYTKASEKARRRPPEVAETPRRHRLQSARLVDGGRQRGGRRCRDGPHRRVSSASSATAESAASARWPCGAHRRLGPLQQRADAREPRRGRRAFKQQSQSSAQVEPKVDKLRRLAGGIRRRWRG